MSERQLTNREVQDLADINWSYEGAYDATFDGELFRARYLGDEPGDDLTDTSIRSLREQIRHDYQYREGGLPRGD